jgi:hypothetical protein
MKKGVALSIVGVFLLILTGCAQSLRYSPLTNESLSKVSAVRIYGHVAQDKLTAQVQASNISGLAGGGLLLALIDHEVTANRAAKMAEVIKPIQDQTADFDFRKTLENALQESSGNLHIPDAKVAGVLTTFNADERRQLFEKNSENAILQIQMIYWLTSDCKRLMVGTSVYLWVRGNDTPIFYNDYGYHTPPVTGSSDITEIVKAWSDNKGEKLRLKLTEGISETIKLLERDLSQQQDIIIASTTPLLWVIPFKKKLTYPSYLEKNGNRYIIRAPNGALLLLSSDDTL